MEKKKIDKLVRRIKKAMNLISNQGDSDDPPRDPEVIWSQEQQESLMNLSNAAFNLAHITEGILRSIRGR